MPDYHQVGSQTLLDGLRNALQNGCVGNGVANDSAAVSTLANTTLSAGGIIYFPVGTYRISDDITIPAGIGLWFSPGAKLSVDSGKTVTLNGKIQADTSQIFSGVGVVNVSASSAATFPAEWWGAVGDSSTDSAAAINAAILSVYNAGGGTVIVGGGTFIAEVPIVLRSQVSIAGSGMGSTSFKLKNSANCDVMASATNVDTYMNSGNVSVGEHYLRLSHFSIDGNKSNNSSGRGLACYWYKNYIEHVVVSNCKDQGIYEGWGSFGNPTPFQDMSNTYVDVTVTECDSTEDQWYHNGPHDSKFFGCIVCQGVGKSNLRTGVYGSGAMFSNCHTWSELGVRQPLWSLIAEGDLTMWCNSTAEGGSTGQVLIRAADFKMTGGAQYSIDPSFHSIGIQIGDSANGFTGITGYSIQTTTINFQVATVAFNSDGGLGSIDISGFNTIASTLFTGTPASTSIINIYITGTGAGTLTVNPNPMTVSFTPTTGLLNFASGEYRFNSLGNSTYFPAGFPHFESSALGAQIGLMKSRNGTPGSHTIVQNNDILGQLVFAGDDGVDYNSIGGVIGCAVDGTPGVGDMPARIVFLTTPDGTDAAVERMRITSEGNIVVGLAALLTNAANGFVYVPTCAGAPSGTPTDYTGRSPIVIDTSNNRLYFYSSGAWRNAGP